MIPEARLILVVVEEEEEERWAREASSSRRRAGSKTLLDDEEEDEEERQVHGELLRLKRECWSWRRKRLLTAGDGRDLRRARVRLGERWRGWKRRRKERDQRRVLGVS